MPQKKKGLKPLRLISCRKFEQRNLGYPLKRRLWLISSICYLYIVFFKSSTVQSFKPHKLENSQADANCSISTIIFSRKGLGTEVTNFSCGILSAPWLYFTYIWAMVSVWRRLYIISYKYKMHALLYVESVICTWSISRRVSKFFVTTLCGLKPTQKIQKDTKSRSVSGRLKLSFELRPVADVATRRRRIVPQRQFDHPFGAIWGKCHLIFTYVLFTIVVLWFYIYDVDHIFGFIGCTAEHLFWSQVFLPFSINGFPYRPLESSVFCPCFTNIFVKLKWTYKLKYKFTTVQINIQIH